MQAWNAQPIFAGEPAPLRADRDFDRGELATALMRGSVGGQQDLRAALSKLQLPILWLAGERDLKYAKLACESAALNPRFYFEAIPDAGHRVPWTHTGPFRDAVRQFLEQ